MEYLVLRSLAAALIFVCAGATAATAGTVLSTAHYQEGLQLPCDAASDSCTAEFPKPGAKHRVHLTRATCHFSALQGTVYANGYMTLQTASGHAIVFEFLPLDYSGISLGYTQFLLNRAIDLQVGPIQNVRMTFTFDGGSPAFGLCKVSGTIDTLR